MANNTIATTQANPIDTTQANPFELVAYLFFKVRHSLEDEDALGHPPRWVRIVRAREAKTELIGGGVMTIVNGFANSVAYMAELCLKLRELLLQTDAGKALLEVSLDLVAAATDPNFVTGVRTLVGLDPSKNPAAAVDVNNAILKLKEGLKYIPEPEDLDRLGHELYRLLCCEQLPFPRQSNSSAIDGSKVPVDGLYVDLERSGKLRLMQWGYGSPLKVFGLVLGDKPLELVRLGARWLWQPPPMGSTLPKHTIARWPSDSPRYTVYEFSYDQAGDDGTRDLQEVYDLLAARGYKDDSPSANQTSFTDKLSRLLQEFQHMNDLPRTGELDNATLNRLMNLDFSAKNLTRAIAHDPAKVPAVMPRGGYLELVNPDADHPADEGLTVVTPAPGYAYYVCGVQLPAIGPAELPRGRGWISYGAGPDLKLDANATAHRTPGFVALESRQPLAGASNADANFEGGIWTEGEAASGRFFFCARSVEPWIPGRHGELGSNPKYAIHTPLVGRDRPTKAFWSGLFQWIDIAYLMTAKPPGCDLVLQATALQRSLYTDRGGKTDLADQGAISLSVYDAGTYAGPSTRVPELAMRIERSNPFPTKLRATAEISASQVDRTRTWILQATRKLTVPTGAVAALVGIAGQWQSGYDIDAYFDNVTVGWDYVPTPPTVSAPAST